jgi:cell fate (sporulation/competence/biofilm development) regulator YlbF (YheA/YmcA/DUF963 family)
MALNIAHTYGGTQMTLYDLAHQMASVFKESVEYREYLRAKQKIEREPGALHILQDFKNRELQWRSAKLLGKDTEKIEEQIDMLKSAVESHPLVSEFLAAEHRFMVVLADVQKILSDSIDIWTYGLEGPAEQSTPKE